MSSRCFPPEWISRVGTDGRGVQNKGYTELHGHGFLSMRERLGPSAFSLRLVKVTKVNKSTWCDVIIQTDRNGV